MDRQARAPLAIVTALLAAALAGCGVKAPEGAPPRATDAIDVPSQSSVIAVPVTARLDLLRAALEREVPRTLWTIDKPDQVCVQSDKVKVLVVKVKTPTIKCRLVGAVTRGAMQIGGKGRDIVITMPLRAVIRARDIGGVLKQETATANAQVRAVVRLDLTPDWQLRGTVNIVYDWTREPGIDFMGRRIEFTSKADAKLKGVVDRVERLVAREIARLNVRDDVTRAWGQAFTSLQLNRANPPVWMRITPQDLQYGGYAVTGNRVVLKLGMRAQTESFVGDRPPDPERQPLPPVRPLDERPGELLFYIPVIADYAELEPVIAEALVKRSARPFDVPAIGPVNAQFGKVTAYGTTGGRVAVGVTFTARDVAGRLGTSRGTVWLSGMPVNQPNSRQVAFTDLKVSGTTDSEGADLLLALANSPALSSVIAEALGQNFTRDYEELLGKITRAIDETREGDFVIRARIANVRTGALKAAGQGIYLPVWGTGTASITLAR